MSRVFILDYDLISPIGLGRNAVLQSLLQCALAGRVVTRFCTDGLPVNVAAEVCGDFSACLNDEPQVIRDAAKYDRKLELTLACYKQMAPRLRWVTEKIAPERKGVVFGIGLDVPPMEMAMDMMAGFSHQEMPILQTIWQLNKQRGVVNTVLNPIDLAALYLADKLELGAFQKSVLTACAASTQAVAMGINAIRYGKADLVLAGGSDSLLNLTAYIGFAKLGVIQPSNEPPARTCKPLDVNRNGTLLGEGAGLILLSSERAVQQIGCLPALELLGYGNTLDGYKITAPDPTGNGMKMALKRTLKDAGLSPGDVDYIHLHGTGTRANDPVELAAVIDVFGDDAQTLMASSTKDRHGHLIAAAGIQELTLLCLAMENNVVPCTVNLEKPIVSKEIDLVMHENRFVNLDVCLTNSFAFGGINTVLAVKKVA